MTHDLHRRTVGDYVTLCRGTTYKGLLVGEPGPALLGLGSIEPGGGFRFGHYKTYGGDCPPELMLRIWRSVCSAQRCDQRREDDRISGAGSFVSSVGSSHARHSQACV